MYNRVILKYVHKFNHPKTILQKMFLLKCVSRYERETSFYVFLFNDKELKELFFVHEKKKERILDYYHSSLCWIWKDIEQRSVCKKVFNLIRHFFYNSLNRLSFFCELCLFHGNVRTIIDLKLLLEIFVLQSLFMRKNI